MYVTSGLLVSESSQFKYLYVRDLLYSFFRMLRVVGGHLDLAAREALKVSKEEDWRGGRGHNK